MLSYDVLTCFERLEALNHAFEESFAKTRILTHEAKRSITLIREEAAGRKGFGETIICAQGPFLRAQDSFHAYDASHRVPRCFRQATAGYTNRCRLEANQTATRTRAVR